MVIINKIVIKYIDINEILCVDTFYNILRLIKLFQLEIRILGILRNILNKKMKNKYV